MPVSLRVSNNRQVELFRAAVAILLFTFVQAVSGSEEGAFSCAAATEGGAEQKHQAALELLKHSYDTDRLQCGATVMITFADTDTSAYDTQLSALQANARAIYYLDRIVVYELGYLISWYVTEVPMETKLNAPMLALRSAQEQHLRILKQARDAGFDTAELDYYEAMTLGVNVKALPLLQGAIEKDASSLKGEAHALLAETYYALPDVVGGDLDLAIKMLRSAREQAPDNPRYAQLLASYLLDRGQSEEASAILKELLSMQADMAGWQLLADQLRIAADMAQRIGDGGLAEQLDQRRAGMLEQHAFLQTRSVVSAMGHFGSNNPMTVPD